MEPTYTKTRLWKALQSRVDANSGKAKLALQAYMDEIETILGKGSPLKDFTLHDQDHSFRVVNRMADIIPPDVIDKLSSFELAFLLFSAYLHDIGMTPEYSKVEQLYSYLGSAPESWSSSEEAEDFQRWMDGEDRTITGDNAAELVTYYCRHKHNDWSGDWIREHIKESPSSLVLYSGWVDDLIGVCRSHHQEYNELIKDSFNPITRNGSVVHLRYLAAVLRIADILEFDPERTPEILFRHRQVDGKSRIYWLKDREVGLQVDSKSVRIEARPSRAILHRAIEVMINEIDHELQVCRNLDARWPFHHNPADPKVELPHRWDLEPLVLRTIQPKQENGRPAYEYIDGAFRPDTGKLLSLLGGTQLYGSPVAAVRELLQNAFDAVNERIAQERLSLPDPLDRNAVEALRTTHRVKMTTEERENRVYLVCADNGVGMSKSVIRDYLLVSGSRRRKELGSLARLCSGKGFQLDRSGQFGIGVLSYFMLADKVTLRTWRNEGESAEAVGWCFETEGIGSFGELRPDPKAKRGTEVTLRLRRELDERTLHSLEQQAALQTRRQERENSKTQAASWPRTEIFDYLQSTLLRVPCNFEFEPERENVNLSVGPGWVSSKDRVRKALLHGTVLAEYFPDSQKRLDQKIWEGDLPGGAGIYELLLPYFNLAHGVSLAYFDSREPRHRGTASNPIGVLPDFTMGADLPSFQFGWRGMAVDSFGWNNNAQDICRLLHGQVDWLSDKAGKITVNRNEFQLADLGLNASVWLRSQVQDCVKEFLSRHTESRYHLINCHLADLRAGEPEAVYWKYGQDADIKEIVFPAATNLDLRWCSENMLALAWRGNPVTVLPQLEVQLTSGKDLTRVNPNFEIFRPTAVSSYATPRFGIAAVFANWRQSPEPELPGVSCSFPAVWKRLAAVQFNGPGTRNGFQYLWNPANPIIEALNPEIWEQMLSRHPSTHEALKSIGDLKGRPTEAPVWLLRALMANQSLSAELLERCRRRRPSWLPVCIWHEDPSNPHLAVLGAEGEASLSFAYSRAEVEKYLPHPGAEWEFTLRSKVPLGFNMSAGA